MAFTSHFNNQKQESIYFENAAPPPVHTTGYEDVGLYQHTKYSVYLDGALSKQKDVFRLCVFITLAHVLSFPLFSQNITLTECATRSRAVSRIKLL
jgi:hypothetical protein